MGKTEKADFRVAYIANDIRNFVRNFEYVICIKVGRETVKLTHDLATRIRMGLIV